MINKQEKLVSIIMPAYNSERFIGLAIESIQNQSYLNWEVIIVDDCSTDATAQVVNAYKEVDDRIIYHKLDNNSGAAAARNKALDLATGSYMAFLDSDDIWFADKLKTQIDFMENNDISFSCTSYIKIDEQGESLDQVISVKDKSDYDMLLKNCPGNSTVMYNADKLGIFKIPDIRKRNDYVMWLQIIKKSKHLYGLKEPLGCHRINPNGISRNKVKLIKYHWIVYRDIEKLPVLKSCCLVTYWVAKTVLKKMSIG